MNNTLPGDSRDDPTQPAPPTEQISHPAPPPVVDLTADITIHSVRVGNYQLKRQIGSGGMGAVYEAVQDSPRRPVALKLMRNPLGSPSNLRRFQYESQLLARLRHPGIAEVYEAGTFQQGGSTIPFYTMEFIPGAKNIAQYVRDNMLGTRQTIELFLRVCDALHHAHSRGVIHRDLKPANILVDAAGEPKIIDFGIARALDSDQAPATLQTRADQLLGTLQYMSPEQLDSDPSALDPRSDVYSMGVMLYELLCGRLPYDVSTSRLHEASSLIREMPPTSPRIVKPELSRDLEIVLLTALQKERGRRYGSVQELGDDLRRVLDDLPIAARGDSAVYRVRTHVRRAALRRRVEAAVVAMLVALFLGEWVSWNYLGGIFDQFYERLLTTRVASAPPSLRSVVVLAMRDETDWRALAREIGAGEVDPGNVPTLRRLHTALLKSLIGADARAVVFDIQFPREVSGIDDDFAAAIRALIRDGTAVVVGAPNWRLRSDGLPEISPIIAREARSGSMLAHLSREAAWSIDLFVKPDSHALVPSLALSAAAAYWNPTLTPTFEYHSGSSIAIIHFGNPTSTTRPGASPTAVDEEVQLMRMRYMELDRPEQGISASDVGGQYLISLPDTAAMERSTLDYAVVARMTPDQRRACVRGRLVLIGDLRANRDGPFDTPDGRRVAGVYAHAVAIDSIISRSEDAPRLPGMVKMGPLFFYGRYPLDLLAALLGAAIAFRFAGFPIRRLSAIVGIALLIIVFSVIVFRLQRVVIAPIVALLVLPLSAELVALVERERRRGGTTNGSPSLRKRRSQ